MTTTTYISKIAKNGKTQYFRVDADGKKKMVKRGEYEANMPAGGQVQFEEVEPVASADESSATLAEIVINGNSVDKTDSAENAESEYIPETIPERPAVVETSAVINPFDFVKAAVESVAGRYKLTYKEWKKYGSIYYRSCAICGFVLDDVGNVAAVRFMGTTLDSRKTVTEREVKADADWQYIAESAQRQIAFVNEWWNPTEKSA